MNQIISQAACPPQAFSQTAPWMNNQREKKHLRIAMIGAGSPGFSWAVAEELVRSELLHNSTFVLMDIDAERLDASAKNIRQLVASCESPLQIETTLNRRDALRGANYVVTSCEKQRTPYWIKDIEIPRRYGVTQTNGENGGPGGQIHAMRNITLFMEICRDMRELCPDAWLLNFTNPMSYLCTYFERGGGIKWLGFCHQAHGSFGVIAEMLGMEPGELEIVSGGVNHFNWLMDLRLRGTGQSCLPQFLQAVRESDYWRVNRENVPPQQFTRDVLDVFGAYPVGYDDHWAEYVSFFYPESEWQERGYEWNTVALEKYLKQNANGSAKKNGNGHIDTLTAVEMKRAIADETPPFPKDPNHPYYREHACKAIEALETNTPTYFDAINIVNRGAIPNLPDDAIVDIPGLAVGGQVRSVHVGRLPMACAELCRRQVTLHEMVVEATMQGDKNLALQAMCLQPQISSIAQARKVLDMLLQEYSEELPQFNK